MRAYTSPGSGKTAQPSVKKKSNSVPISTGRSSSSSQRKFGWKFYVLVLLALVIVGTFTVLRTVVHFFGVHDEDVISTAEVQSYTNIEALPFNAELSPSQAREEEEQLGLKREKIPRIIHQTWKSEVLPEKWETVRNECMAMLPDFEFKLWSDADSREFIATEYPAFLNTWDSYRELAEKCDSFHFTLISLILQPTQSKEPMRFATSSSTSTVVSTWISTSAAERTPGLSYISKASFPSLNLSASRMT